MTASVAKAQGGGAGLILRRAVFLTLILLTLGVISVLVGPREALILAVGLGIGALFEGQGFGFAGPWRRLILNRDPAGVLAQLLCIGLVAAAALPLLQAAPDELIGAHAPVGFAMVLGAFVFGVAMQVVLGCGSGTLINAGSGNAVGLVALPFFALGSFLGAFHLVEWTSLGTLPTLAVSGFSGVILTWLGLGAVVLGLWLYCGRVGLRLPRRLLLVSLILALLAIGHLVIAGQPWGVVYGLGLWVAKGAAAVGIPLEASTFWSAPGQVTRVEQSLLTDVTSLTNIGLIIGAFSIGIWRKGDLSRPVAALPLRAWLAVMIAGLALGYSSRLAFGCNVGAFFSGISTGSLHGWVWMVAAFAGSFWGIRLRPLLGLEARS